MKSIPEVDPTTRVARFFLVQNTKTGENIPNYHKIYQIGIFGLKTNHLATLPTTSDFTTSAPAL
jgi:hypothetical protein